MADEKEKAPATAPTVEKNPPWRYVGPGSEGRKKEEDPLISNLPLDLGQPVLGMISGSYHASELPAKYIAYVMATNPTTKGWWV